MPVLKISCVNYSSSLYLSNCDLINRTLLSNLYRKPRLDKVVLSLSLNESSDYISKKIESFLMLYLFKLQKSFLSLNDSSSEDLPPFFKLKVTISEEQDLNLFLLSLFIENGTELVVEKSLDGELNKLEESLKVKNFGLKSHLNAGFFFELNDFLKANFLEPKLNDLSLNIQFFFKGCNLHNQEFSRKLIKTIPLFWISC